MFLYFKFPNGYNKNYILVIDPVLVAATLSGTIGLVIMVILQLMVMEVKYLLEQFVLGLVIQQRLVLSK